MSEPLDSSGPSLSGEVDPVLHGKIVKSFVGIAMAVAAASEEELDPDVSIAIQEENLQSLLETPSESIQFLSGALIALYVFLHNNFSPTIPGLDFYAMMQTMAAAAELGVVGIDPDDPRLDVYDEPGDES